MEFKSGQRVIIKRAYVNDIDGSGIVKRKCYQDKSLYLVELDECNNLCIDVDPSRLIDENCYYSNRSEIESYLIKNKDDLVELFDAEKTLFKKNQHLFNGWELVAFRQQYGKYVLTLIINNVINTLRMNYIDVAEILTEKYVTNLLGERFFR